MRNPTADAATLLVETRIWLEEDRWLHDLYKSPQNVSPRLWTEDLISACVSIVLQGDCGPQGMFAYMRGYLALRDPKTKRHVRWMWRPQYELLQRAQRSAENAFPFPQFQLDQFTTACVALTRQSSPDGARVFRQARINMAARTLSPPAQRLVN